MTKKEAYYVNRKIQRIKKLLSDITTLGLDITRVFEEEYGIDDYDWNKIPNETNRRICETANNCGMIETWNELYFGNNVCEANE